MRDTREGRALALGESATGAEGIIASSAPSRPHPPRRIAAAIASRGCSSEALVVAGKAADRQPLQHVVGALPKHASSSPFFHAAAAVQVAGKPPP
jgi:hypothetical protein